MNNYNQANSKKENQLIFVEYPRATTDGHFITATDSYRNTLGKIHRSWNDETKKYEYAAFDHTGKPISQMTEKLWELKKMFIDNSKQLLEQAHQRRIESKNAQSVSLEKTQRVNAKPEDERRKETQNLRQGKPARQKEAIKDKSGERANGKSQPSRAASASRNESPLQAYRENEREEKNQVTWDETEQAIRESELDSLRESEDGREDYDLER